MAYKSLSTNVIPMPFYELDCISPYMVLDVCAFKISSLGIFCQSIILIAHCHANCHVLIPIWSRFHPRTSSTKFHYKQQT
jgi:hypothetical protein